MPTMDPWKRHWDRYWRSHQDQTFKEVLQNAKKTYPYRTKKAPKKKVTFKKKLTTWHYYDQNEAISPPKRRRPAPPSTYRGRRT